MRLLWILLCCCIVGCGGGNQPPRMTQEEEEAAERQVKITSAKKAFATFVEEATKGLEVLHSHPNYEKVDALITKLGALQTEAAGICPENPKMDVLGRMSSDIMRFFRAVGDTASYQKIEKIDKGESTPEKAQVYIDKACQSNGKAIAEVLGMMKEKLK